MTMLNFNYRQITTSNFLAINVLLIILILANYIVVGDVIRLGRCPEVKLHRNFRSELFAGEWYEIAKNPMIVLANTKCNKMSLEYDYQKNMFNMKSSSILKAFNKEVVFEANAFSQSQDEKAKLTIQYPLTLFRTNLTFSFWVLYTDYDNTALIWSCSEYLKFLHLEYFWIFSRKPYLNEEKILDLTDKLAMTGIISSYAVKTDQHGCMI